MTERGSKVPTEAQVETLLSTVLRQDDPVAALARAAADPDLPAGLRRALGQVDPDGLRLSALLVARLRFERLLRGSPPAERLFDEDPAAFAALFRRYHRAVPPTAFFPRGEAALFAAFTERPEEKTKK